MKNLIDHVKESLLDGEDELMDRVKLIPLMKLVEARDNNTFSKVYHAIAEQFDEFYKENKIYIRGRSYDFTDVKNNEIIIYFGFNEVRIGYKDFRKASLSIFYSDFTNSVVVSVREPFVNQSLSNFALAVYKLPTAYKEDFEKIVKKYQNDRKGRLL
jgi:hypothetical protein